MTCAPRTRPGSLAADRGYDSRTFRQLRARGIRHAISARRHHGLRRQRGRSPQVPVSVWLHRWKVERFFA